MWKYGSKTIREHKSWVDDNGITHPRNWHIWSADEKAAAGLTEVTPETPPDSRLYTWGYKADGVTISKTAISMTDVGLVDSDGNAVNDDDGNQIMQPGVRSQLKSGVKSQQASLLAQTDWAVVRKSEKTTEIPSNISTWRDAIRTKATAMESAVDGAADTAAVAALFVAFDADGNKSGILYDWPVLGS
jgi:hypothetical protein|tara:strand:+ start:480 stop:1043 length:564 start_codon:yes stop_codon:yes gene_type:complete